MNFEGGIIKVFIVAASQIARAGLEAVLQTNANVIVTGGAAEMPPAPTVFSSSPAAFDVLLINVERRKDFNALTKLTNGGENGEAATDSAFPVVALLAPDFQSGGQIARLLRGAVRGVLPSDASSDEISAAIAAAAADLIVVAPEISGALFLTNGREDFPSDEENDFQPDAAVENLTARERQVLEMLTEGASNKTIAERMNISEHTVKFHVASIFGKFGVNSRTEAVTQAIRRGLILL